MKKDLTTSDLTDEIVDQIRAESSRIFNDLNKCQREISLSILITATCNYLYQFKDFKELFGEISDCVNKSFELWGKEDS